MNYAHFYGSRFNFALMILLHASDGKRRKIVGDFEESSRPKVTFHVLRVENRL